MKPPVLTSTDSQPKRNDDIWRAACPRRLDATSGRRHEVVSWLRHTAEQVAVEYGDYFLAGPLTRYARARRLDDPELAAYLGVSLRTLHGLKLCQTPTNPDEVERVSSLFAVDSRRLVDVLAT